LKKLPSLVYLTKLNLFDCVKVKELEISHFPALKEMVLRDNNNLRLLIINGSSLVKLEVWETHLHLEILEIRTSSLKRCHLTNVYTTKPLKLFHRFRIPNLHISNSQVDCSEVYMENTDA
jgi:hypothetical protein